MRLYNRTLGTSVLKPRLKIIIYYITFKKLQKIIIKYCYLIVYIDFIYAKWLQTQKNVIFLWRGSLHLCIVKATKRENIEILTVKRWKKATVKNAKKV